MPLSRSLTGCAPDLRRHVVKANEIDFFSAAVPGHLQKIKNAEESRRARQLRCDVREADWLNRINLDRAFFHPIEPAHLNVRRLPYAHAPSDLSAPDRVSKPLGERHAESLRSCIRSERVRPSTTPPRKGRVRHHSPGIGSLRCWWPCSAPRMSSTTGILSRKRIPIR